MERDPIHTVSCRHHGSSLALVFFLVRVMVTATRVTEQKRLQKQRERARLAKQPRKWKAYLMEERDRKRRDRANSKIRFEAKLKAVKKQAVQAHTERLRKIQAAQKEFLRARIAAQAQQLEKCKKQVSSERAKARAAVASIAQQWKDGLAQQASAYNKQLKEKVMLYKKGKVEEEKRTTRDDKEAERWETWWSRLPVEERRSILRVTRSKQHGSSFWDPGLHGRGHVH